MSLTTSKRILTIILILWLFTVFRSITIMIGGKKIFVKASKGEKSSLYPIINLFSMLEVVDLSTYFGILLFVPVINMVILSIMSYKLGSVFQTSFLYKICLVLCPIIFYPLLGSSKYIYKLKDDNYFKALDNAKNESINLMTDEEIQKENEIPYEEEKIEVDSIFKSKVDTMEKVAPYKAAKIDLYGMEKLKQNNEEKKSIEEIMKSQEEVEKEKKDDIEMLDL